MSNQEMQFADPDWKPSQKLDTNTDSQEREGYHPQPINTEYREQNQWRSQTSAPQEAEGYTGLRPYAGPTPPQVQSGNFRQRQYRRRGRSPLFWIILAFIIISLASGGFRSFNSRNFESPFPEKQFVGKPISFNVSATPTIVNNDPNGNVTVTQGQSNSV